MRISSLLLALTFFGPCSGGIADKSAPDAAPTATTATSSTVSAAPTTKATTTAPVPATVVLGDYACTHDTWVGAMPNRQRQSTPVGSITFVDGATYRWLDNGGTGHYRAEGATITWVDGPIADKKPKKSTYRKNVKTTQVDVTFADGFDWSCGHNL